MIDDMLGVEQQVVSSKPRLQDCKKFKHDKEVSQEDRIQYLKQHLLVQPLVHHKHVMCMINKSNVFDLIKILIFDLI